MDQQRISTNAIVSLILSIFAVLLSFIIVGALFAIPAVVYGHIALSEIRRSDRRVGGEGLAISGLVVGYVSIALAAIATVVACVAIWIASQQTESESDEDGEYTDADVTDTSADGAYTQALGQLSIGRQSYAETLLDTACTTYPYDQRLLFAKAACAHSRFSKRLSMHMLNEVAKMNPSTPEGKCADAILNLETGKAVPRHFRELTAVLDQNPTNALILWMVGIQCRVLSQSQNVTNYSAKGAECYRRLLQQWEVGPVLVHQTYANILSEELGRHEEALTHRRLAVQLEPRGWTYQGLGNTLLHLERYDEANEAFAKATELAPDDAQYWRNWAWNLHCQGNYEESIAKCRRSAELDPQEKRVWIVWADNMDAMGRKEEAVAKYRKHLEYHPDDYETKARMESLLVVSGGEKEFQKRFQALKSLPSDAVLRVEAFLPYGTNLVFSTTDPEVVNAFCSACSALCTQSNTPRVMLKNPCNFVVTTKSGERHEFTVSLYIDETMAWGHFASFDTTRQSPVPYGRFAGRELAQWLTKNVHLPRPQPAVHPGVSNRPQPTTQPQHAVSNRPPAPVVRDRRRE